MGLSSKQVSSDHGLDWSKSLMEAQKLELPKPPPMARRQQPQQQNQSQNQQSELVKCPRCDSTNTKFCYYNNYNKSQPRHFCRTCKRHWTKGGTLRNVPVGGGRKNKRPKKSTPATPGGGRTASAASAKAASIDTSQGTQKQSLSMALGEQRSLSDVHFQGLVRPPCSLPSSDQLIVSSGEFNCKSFSLGDGSFMGANQSLNFPFSSTSSSASPVLTPVQSSDIFGFKAMEEPASSITHQWQIPTTTSCGMEIPSYWNWDDIDAFNATDLNLQWDDPDIKP